MGLDQYLYAETYVSTLTADTKQFEQLLEASNHARLAPTLLKTQARSHALVSVNVGYWRKVNAVHKYFVDKYADGVDECQRIPVPREGLEELRDICLLVLEERDRADELLPTTAGFFFGSTDYDEYYFSDVEYTIDTITRVLNDTAEDSDYFYQASW